MHVCISAAGSSLPLGQTSTSMPAGQASTSVEIKLGLTKVLFLRAVGEARV